MSLTDLKRKKLKTDRSKLTVDDFIEDANNYAFGKPSVIDVGPDALVPPPTVKKGLDKKTTKSYRHATFTLTERSIAQLDKLAKQTKVAKSKLLRLLIEEFSQKTTAEQVLLIKKDRET